MSYWSHVRSQEVSRLRVLWIDDEPTPLGSSVLLLQEGGYHVDLAVDGADGLARVRSWSPHIVLLDLRLPDMPGLAVLDAMRRDRLGIPVVIVSGHGTGNAGFEARRLGAVEFLAKPFHGLELLALIDQVASGRYEAAGVDRPTRSGVQPQAIEGGVFQGPAHVRVAKAIVLVAVSPRDVPTVAKWAELVGPAQHTLENWSEAARVSPSEALRFGRLLRASVRFERLGRDFSESLEVVDPRTLSHLFQLAGATGPSGSPPRTVAAFLDRQRALQDLAVLQVVRELLARDFPDLAPLR